MNTILYFLKTFFIIIYTYYILSKLLNKKMKIKNIIIIFIVGIILSWLCSFLKERFNLLVAIVVTYFLYSVVISKVIHKKIVHTFTVVGIAFAISLITYVIAVISSFLFGRYINKVVALFIIEMIHLLIIRRLLSIKKFQKGIIFLESEKFNNEYFDIIMINISAIVILTYSIFENQNKEIIKFMIFPFLIVSSNMSIMIQKTLTLYYKQKLLDQNIEQYKNDIADKDKKMKELSDEKFKISKVNHEFYHRQKALELKVLELTKNNSNEGKSEKIVKEIDNLSKEYSDKMQKLNSFNELTKTDIDEIDDMFTYMKSECDKDKIEFKLYINGNIYYMINNLIKKSQLVTMIGDHIKDAIIAINSSENTYRSILVILGINNRNI